MNMGLEIKRVVQELGKVTINQVLHEAIMNAIDAKAKNINVKIDYQALDEEISCNINNMVVTDDGEGFTSNNTRSFSTYKSTHKQEIGAKGVGRFLFLKLFDEVFISSLDNEIKFDINDVVVTKASGEGSQKTVVNFLSAKNNAYVELDKIENDIKEHFLPYFHLIKTRQEKKIKINLSANGEDIFSISSEGIPDLETDTFKLKQYTFSIAYVLNYYDSQKNTGFYCADNRVVIKNNTTQKQRPQLIKLKTFNEINILFLLSGNYLDKKVNETRDNFEIYPRSNMYEELSWEDVQEGLSEKLRQILLDNDIDIEAKAKENLNNAINKAPYLSRYLTENPYGKNSEKLIENAEKLLYEDKKNLREGRHKNQQEYQEKLAVITHSELAEYIFDRQKIIDNLSRITHEDTLEKEIHNLFMKKNTENNAQDYRSNNLWLFDDRFMIYDKVFSDKQIKDIFPVLSENLDRPDIVSIVSNTYNKEDITDIVIIEFKKPNVQITPAGAEEQLLKYARYVNESHEIDKIRIWTYAFLAFDKNTIDALSDKSYNKIPTQSEYAIYYQYHKAHNVIINFMDYKAIADDANTRNKTFMNILSNNT